ncbi:MAG: DNA repair protein RecO, partial [Rhizobiales bacterium]|nr:DNA repair protein RecO [Hyphomicrobiales bacterium]
MEWTDEGIVLGIRRHGEANAIAEVMTVQHGRHLGLVRGGAGTRLRPVLQPGNSVRVTWRARLDEHLGAYAVEAVNLRAAAFLLVPHALYGITHLCTLTRLLPERDPHPGMHDALLAGIEALAEVGVGAVGI